MLMVIQKLRKVQIIFSILKKIKDEGSIMLHFKIPSKMLDLKKN